MKSKRLASFQIPSKKSKRDSRYIASDNEEEDLNETMNKGFIQYSVGVFDTIH